MINKDKIIDKLRQENRMLHAAVRFLNGKPGVLPHNPTREGMLGHPVSPGDEAPLHAAAGRPRAAVECGHNRNLRRLAWVCYELQRMQGDKPFWLSCRHAGAMLGTSHTQTARYIHELVDGGILEVVTEHTSNRARQYRYVEI